MSKAEIQGETHLSRKDKRTLMELDLSRFDVVFREGHEGSYLDRKLTVGYALFAIGHLLYGATYGRLYVSTEDFEQKVIKANLQFYKIDAGISEIFEMVPRWKRALLLIISPFYTAIGIGLIVGGAGWVLGLLGINFPDWISIIGAIFFLFFFGLAWPLGYFLLIAFETMDDRDEYMAENIMTKTTKNGFESVLVSCGDGHRDGIATYLEDRDWDVDPYPTDSWIGKGLILIDRISWGILNPRKVLRRAYSILNRRWS